MDSHAFERLLAALDRLTHEQRDALEQTLRQPSSPAQAQHIIQARLDGNACCPHCAGTRLYRHGQVHGLARYRCTACGKTFNALTGTPLARLRLKAKWLDYFSVHAPIPNRAPGDTSLRYPSQHELSLAPPFPAGGQAGSS